MQSLCIEAVVYSMFTVHVQYMSYTLLRHQHRRHHHSLRHPRHYHQACKHLPDKIHCEIKVL